jgi:hypothetical protein
MKRLIPIVALLATISLAHAQGTFYRAADGKWKPLKSTTGAVTKFSLSPDDIGGGTTMVVLDKPKWMVLDDDEAPVIVKILLDGQERKADDLDLGQVAKAPAELAFAVKDDKNPLDAAGLSVMLNGKPVPAPQITTTKLTPDGKSLRVAVKLGDLAPAKYSLVAEVADMSPARNVQTVALKFSTAPLVTNGSFEDVESTGKPVAWSPGTWGDDDPTTYKWEVVPGGTAGEKALRVTSTKGGNLTCSNEMDPLKPGTPYVLTGQYKSAGAGVSVITYDPTGKQIDYLTQNLPAAKDWTPFSYEFAVKPHVKSSVVLRTGSKGETWFDDIRVNLK